MKPKILEKEGITPEFLKTIDMSKKYSPVQLRPKEDPVKLIKCSTGYWVMIDFGHYLKDENEKLIVISEQEAKIGRARYIINFNDVILEEALLDEAKRLEFKIQEEVNLLKSKVVDKLNIIMPNIREILLFSGYVQPVSLEHLVLSASKKSDVSHRIKVAKCTELASEGLKDFYLKLDELQKKKDYDSLYVMLFQDGLPQIALFNRYNSDDAAVFSKFFSSENLVKTIEELADKSHLYKIAKFNVEQQLATN